MDNVGWDGHRRPTASWLFRHVGCAAPPPVPGPKTPKPSAIIAPIMAPKTSPHTLRPSLPHLAAPKGATIRPAQGNALGTFSVHSRPFAVQFAVQFVSLAVSRKIPKPFPPNTLPQTTDPSRITPQNYYHQIPQKILRNSLRRNHLRQSLFNPPNARPGVCPTVRHQHAFLLAT